MMPAVPLIEEDAAGPEVRAVFDDIRKTRKVDWINNFWKALANDPAALRRSWESLKEVMAPGALDPLTKEMFAELIAVVGMANETNRLADGYRVPVDERFENLF